MRFRSAFAFLIASASAVFGQSLPTPNFGQWPSINGAPFNSVFYAIGGALGRPSSADLTNATGLPILTGISGLGSNVGVALQQPLVGTGSLLAGTFSGNTNEALTASGALTSGHCVSLDASGNAVDNGSSCGSSSGAVGSGTTGQLAFYPSSGTNVIGNSLGSGFLPAANNTTNGTAGFLVGPAPASQMNYTAPGSVADQISLQERAQNLAYVSDMGARGSALTTTGAFQAALNKINLTSAIDFQVGDDLAIMGESATSPTGVAGTPTLTLCGTPRSLKIANGYPFDECPNAVAGGATSCTYYVSQDDGNGGLSTAVSQTITTAPSSFNDWQDLYLSFIPSINSYTGPLWRNCGGSDAYLGSAQPRSYVSAVAGTGYALNTATCTGTNTLGLGTGVCLWTSSGGGCTEAATGWVQLVAGVLTQGGVDKGFPGLGCSTSAPPTTVITGLTGGTGASVTLSFIDEFEDAGSVPTWRPDYIPVTHPTATQPDWIVATIGTLVGNTATVCATSSILPACTPVLGLDTVSHFVRHSWTREFVQALASSDVAGSGAGLVHVKVPCGTYDIESPIAITSNNTVLAGDSNEPIATEGCTIIRGHGTAYDVEVYNASASTSHAGIQGFYMDGTNKTGGGYFRSKRGSHIWVADMFDRRQACPVMLIAEGGASLVNLTGNNGWGYGCGNYTFASNAKTQSLVMLLHNVYHNDGGGGHGSTATGGLMRAGFDIDAVQTLFTSNQCAESATWGYGYWVHNDTGISFAGGDPNVPANTAFIHLRCGVEYSAADEFHVETCQGSCENTDAAANGSITGHELWVGPNAAFNWRGGKLNGAALDGAYIDGTSAIEGAQIAFDNQNGATRVPASVVSNYTGVSIGPDVNDAIVAHDRFGEPLATGSPDASEFAPVRVASAATGTVNIEGNNFVGATHLRVVSDTLNPNDASTCTINGAASQPCGYFSPVRRPGLVIRNNAVNTAVGNQQIVDGNPLLGETGVPLILDGGGLTGANGALTLVSGLNSNYSGYVHMPAGAAYSGAPIGWYWFVGNASGNTSAVTAGITTTTLTVTVGDAHYAIGDTFTGTIVGTALTTSGGTPAIGKFIGGTGVSTGTMIVAGSGTSWTVNVSQNVGPITMWATPFGPGTTVSGASVASGNNGTIVTALTATADQYTVNNSQSVGSEAMTLTDFNTGTLKNNLYSSGSPVAPLSPTAISAAAGGGYLESTSNVNALTIPVAGYQFGPNDGASVAVTASLSAWPTSPTSAKGVGLNFGGCSIGGLLATMTTVNSGAASVGGFRNRGVTNSQVSSALNGGANAGNMGTNTSGINKCSVDSTVSENIVIPLNLANPFDNIILEQARIEMSPGVQ